MLEKHDRHGLESITKILLAVNTIILKLNHTQRNVKLPKRTPVAYLETNRQ